MNTKKPLKNNSDPKLEITAIEAPNEFLMFAIGKALNEIGKDLPLIDYPQEDLSTLFKSVFNRIMPPERVDIYEINDRNADIEGLTKKALEFVENAKVRVFGNAFLELLFLAVSSSSAKFLKDRGEKNKTLTDFLPSSSQIDWLDSKRRNGLESVLELRGAGGNTTSKFEWNYNDSMLFVKTVNEVIALWEFIRNFYNSNKGVNPEERFRLIKNEETFKNLSAKYNQECIEKVINRMVGELIAKNSSKRFLTPLALACDHAAFELGIHPKTTYESNTNCRKKPYSKLTLIKNYEEISRGKFERINDSVVHKYSLAFPDPPQE